MRGAARRSLTLSFGLLPGKGAVPPARTPLHTDVSAPLRKETTPCVATTIPKLISARPPP